MAQRVCGLRLACLAVPACEPAVHAGVVRAAEPHGLGTMTDVLTKVGAGRLGRCRQGREEGPEADRRRGDSLEQDSVHLSFSLIGVVANSCTAVRYS